MATSLSTRAAHATPLAQPLARLLDYLANLSSARMVLWCYLLWYLVVAIRYFEPNGRLWLTSTGLSLIIGFARLLNARSGGGQVAIGGWQRFRFFLTPFCVSSFSALVKGKGFVLVVSSDWRDVTMGITVCAGFLGLVALARRLRTSAG